ncbi:hypothetical protein SISNIDRAFT_460666 [Sistotremastrum niveocremeum HHB9708]|uniref:4Fe-4S ferredoxin-type domain-containing protein n=2 Tax=Sistotremastraceae TaxID=3402574 RepID=A0A164NI68_9AGAM|nr:hypothetical protein SISNIDRAFT_460666 [Sistotremastrum niveocremeum HHB9708]KZT35361.1 hypothetical protein SISSUDRAFT_1051526 [Sistotremastrum suecicum HHB10207 ss-3]
MSDALSEILVFCCVGCLDVCAGICFDCSTVRQSCPERCGTCGRSSRQTVADEEEDRWEREREEADLSSVDERRPLLARPLHAPQKTTTIISVEPGSRPAMLPVANAGVQHPPIKGADTLGP